MVDESGVRKETAPHELEAEPVYITMPMSHSKVNVFYRIPIDELRKVISESRSISQVFGRIGLCRSSDQYRPFRKAMLDLGISIEHFKGSYGPDGQFSAALTNDDIFIEHSPVAAATVKRALRRDKLIPYHCALCPNDGTWQGNPLSLQLDHENGINTDQRLKNLRWLCPNCHSQTPTYAGKSLAKTENQRKCPTCNGPTSVKGVLCRKCYTTSTRISDWPNAAELSKRVWDKPLWQLAHELGHSRNDLSEHCRSQGIKLPPKRYWPRRAKGWTHEEAVAPIPPKRPRHVITDELATTMRKMRAGGQSCREIGEQLGFHHTNVARICRDGAPRETCTLPATLEA